MKKEKLEFLIFLASLAASKKTATKSSAYLAREFGSGAQQTVWRWLDEFESEGFVSRNGKRLAITDKARKKLEELQFSIVAALEPKKNRDISIEGTVESGFREGRYYVSLSHYRKQFQKKLGFDPYPGTLNIRLESDVEIGKRRRIAKTAGIRIGGFAKDGRVLGAATCYPARIGGKVDGALIFPDRTHYGDDVVEILAPVYLRGKLKVKDGDKVGAEVIGRAD